MKLNKLLSSLVGVVIVAVALTTVAVASGNCIVISGDLNEKPATRGPQMEKADISIGTYLLLTIRTPAAGFTVAERERIVYMRLTEIFSNERMDADNFVLTKVRGKPTICVGKYRLITVYPRDAEAAGSTSDKLAAKWLKSLRMNLPEVAPINAVAPVPTYDVAVGGALLFRLRDVNGFASLSARGAIVDSRLIEVVSKDGAAPITVRPSGDGHGVYVGEERIVTATKHDAELAGAGDTEDLAEAWAANLKNARPLIKAGLPSG